MKFHRLRQRFSASPPAVATFLIEKGHFAKLYSKWTIYGNNMVAWVLLMLLCSSLSVQTDEQITMHYANYSEKLCI